MAISKREVVKTVYNIELNYADIKKLGRVLERVFNEYGLYESEVGFLKELVEEIDLIRE